MVGISLLTLVPGIIGGSETYARNLVRALGRVGQLDYRVFVPTIAPEAGGSLPATVVTAYRASHSFRGRIRAMVLATLVPRAVRRQLDLDRLGALHFPLGIMLPTVHRPPTATTVHDLQHELYPRFFHLAERVYRRVVYGWTLRRSRLVIAISDHVRQTLLARHPLAPEQVRTIHLGIDPERFHAAPRPRQPFLLYPANRWPHKNHARLFEALAMLRRQRPELTLVLTGASHGDHRVPEGVDVRGRVSTEELVELYRTAAALVFPSLYEGFGLPALEAMACGCPVAASRVGALPEICGDAARYFDPTSPDAIAEGVLDVLARADELAQRGLARAADFTWDRCARRHDAIYGQLLAAR